MSKKLRKIKTRLVSTIQGNYTIDDQEVRNKSSSTNYKLKTLIAQKIESNNSSKLNSKSKRVYLSNMNHITQNHNLLSQSPEKEEYIHSGNQQLKHRYITRVKSSNCGTLHTNSLMNERSIRHTNKISKIIKNISEVQFESELYWNGSSAYLVAGVKNQYEKIKKSYQDKCFEIQKIKKDYNVNQTKQLKIYIDKLEKQNTRLVEACQKFRKKLQKFRQANSHLPELVLQKFKDNNSNDIIEDELIQIYEKYQKLDKKITRLEQKNFLLTKQNKNLVTKVFLQQKIIIQNQNRQFKLNSLCKKLQNELNEVKDYLQENQQKCKSLQQNSQKNLLEVKSLIKEQFMLEKRDLLKKIKQKDVKIDKMDKEITHMKNLLESWKFSHENQPEIEDQNEQKQSEQRRSSMVNENTYQSRQYLQKFGNEKIKLKFKSSKDHETTQNLNFQSQSNANQSQRSLNKSSFKLKAQTMKEGEKVAQINAKRQRVTAMTHKQNSVRCRPVEANEIERIIEYLKLKLGFKRVDPSELTSYFDCKRIISQSGLQKSKDDPNSLSTKGVVNNQQKRPVTSPSLYWEEEYITLKEVYDAFLEQPFQIKEPEAVLLSRFIIEDVKEPYVYMNWDSQNSRRMAKSIIANLLNFQSLKDQTVEKSEELLKKYETVLMPALKFVASKTGQISKEKFTQILNGLGLERTKCMDDYIIGKMCCSSRGLDMLDFSSLYHRISQ